jgi:hypothetical protein
MITGISSSLVQEADRLSVQCHELALEANVANLSDILLTVTPIILDEDGDGGGGVPVGTIQWNFEDVLTRYGLWDLDGLGRGKVGGNGEVQVVAVFE